jgi:hypothetical protein
MFDLARLNVAVVLQNWKEHRGGAKGAAQVHAKEFTPSEHEPPFRQGLDALQQKRKNVGCSGENNGKTQAKTVTMKLLTKQAQEVAAELSTERVRQKKKNRKVKETTENEPRRERNTKEKLGFILRVLTTSLSEWSAQWKDEQDD